jgi:hypothetical protein
MKEGMKNWFLLFTITVVIAILGNFIFPRNVSDEEEEVLGVTNIDYRNSPFITSVPPRVIEVGDIFKYEVLISDLDTEEGGVDIYLEESPGWMSLSGNILYGIPFSKGTYKYVITVSDGVNSSTEVNYLLVE